MVPLRLVRGEGMGSGKKAGEGSAFQVVAQGGGDKGVLQKGEKNRILKKIDTADAWHVVTRECLKGDFHFEENNFERGGFSGKNCQEKNRREVRLDKRERDSRNCHSGLRQKGKKGGGVQSWR